MQQCKLLLDNYTGQYFPGASIQGRVILNFGTDITLRGVKLTLTCREYTEWIGTESYYDTDQKEQRSRDTQFHGENIVLSIEQWLYGDRHGSTNLSVGQHMYPFVLPLQPNLPGTYQCERGSISYKLTATVDRPMALDYEDQMIVMINSPVDLNQIATTDHLQPSSYSDEKTICCWCCANGPITMDVELAKRTLIPGEHVEVKMRLTNMSNINVEGVALELKQIITYKVQEPNREEKEDSNVLVDLKDVGLGAHGENTYLFNVCLPPNVSLPNFSQCRLFNADYVYKTTTKLPNVHTNIEIKMRPLVGHVAFGGQNTGVLHFNPHPPPGYQGTVYPPSMGWSGSPANPSAPTLNSKEQFAGGPGYPGQPEQPPPSYASLNQN